MTDMALAEKLLKIQTELKAPKNQYNDFGKYNYRSAEDILEAVKPLNAKHGLLLYINDEIVEISGRFYVKATATVTTGTERLFVEAFAREDETKRGMDGSQITGASSSYARKYALNGLYLIDDNKDSDTNEYAEHIKQSTSKKNTNSPTKEEQAEYVKKGLKKVADILKEHYNETNQSLIAYVEKVAGKSFKTVDDQTTYHILKSWLEEKGKHS